MSFPISNKITSIIFLEIDGVVLKNRSADAIMDKAKKMYPHLQFLSRYHIAVAGSSLFSQSATENLKTLLMKVDNVGIVLTSNWRKHLHITTLKRALSSYFFSRYIIDKTPDDSDEDYLKYESHLNGKSREIAFWLLKHPEVLNFAVVSAADLGLSDAFPYNYIRVDKKELFSDHNVNMSELILNSIKFPAYPDE